MFRARTAEYELLKEIRGLLLIQQQGLKDMAKSVADMTAALAAVSDKMTTHLADQATIKTELDTAVADLATAVAGSQSGLIDTVVTAMNLLSDQLDTAKANDDAMKSELLAALATVPPPAS